MPMDVYVFTRFFLILYWFIESKIRTVHLNFQMPISKYSTFRLIWLVFLAILFFLDELIYQADFILKDLSLIFGKQNTYILTSKIVITIESITSSIIDYLMAMSFFYLCFIQSKKSKSAFYIPIRAKGVETSSGSRMSSNCSINRMLRDSTPVTETLNQARNRIT